MKAIQVQAFGSPEVLQLREIPTPQPAAGQVLVRVRAAGVNPYDAYMRSGSYAIKPELPYTPGSDAAGIVETVGAGVKGVAKGARVYTATTLSGAYAEYALAVEAQVHPLPERISFTQGAGVWVPYGTAFHALHQRAHGRRGETLLVHGASGGVGIAAVQLARAAGLRVFGTAGSERGAELVRREGASEVFRHDQPDYLEKIMTATAGRGVDVILEMLANVNLGHDLKLLAQNGRVVVIGSRGDVTITPRDLMARRASISAFTLWATTEAEKQEIFAGLGAAMEAGIVRPVVGRELPLAQAAEAHRAILEPGAYGKIVLIP
ncbi:MAG TPA: NADPH:quinone reductase [Terriglobales bacterium]|jgi:NADPH2:quinone reductase